MEVLTTRLSKSALGGHLLIRYEAEGNYLDYYADLPLTNTQRVEYAANLLDIVSERDGTEIYTSILPVGKDGLTIADIADGDLTDDLVKDGLTVYSRSGVAAYGRINRYVRWDDITVVANLLAKAKASVSSAGLATQESITVPGSRPWLAGQRPALPGGAHDPAGQHCHTAITPPMPLWSSSRISCPPAIPGSRWAPPGRLIPGRR